MHCDGERDRDGKASAVKRGCLCEGTGQSHTYLIQSYPNVSKRGVTIPSNFCKFASSTNTTCKTWQEKKPKTRGFHNPQYGRRGHHEYNERGPIAVRGFTEGLVAGGE